MMFSIRKWPALLFSQFSFGSNLPSKLSCGRSYSVYEAKRTGPVSSPIKSMWCSVTIRRESSASRISSNSVNIFKKVGWFFSKSAGNGTSSHQSFSRAILYVSLTASCLAVFSKRSEDSLHCTAFTDLLLVAYLVPGLYEKYSSITWTIFCDALTSSSTFLSLGRFTSTLPKFTMVI